MRPRDSGGKTITRSQNVQFMQKRSHMEDEKEEEKREKTEREDTVTSGTWTSRVFDF